MPSTITNLLTLASLATLSAAGPWSCPESNNTVFLAPSGGKWLVQCDTDTSTNSYEKLITANNFEDCIAQCNAAGADCRFATFTGGDGMTNSDWGSCYFKKDNGCRNVEGTGVKLFTRIHAGNGCRV